MTTSTVDGNRVIASGSGNAGRLHLEGLALTIMATTIAAVPARPPLRESAHR